MDTKPETLMVDYYKDCLDKLLEYIKEQEQQHYDNCFKAFEEKNMIAFITSLAQAMAFQQMKYYAEGLI